MATKHNERKLSLRRLWVIYKQTAVARGFGSSRRELALAHVAFYSGARGVLKVLDYGDETRSAAPKLSAGHGTDPRKIAVSASTLPLTQQPCFISSADGEAEYSLKQ